MNWVDATKLGCLRSFYLHDILECDHILEMPAVQVCQMLWFDLLNNCEALQSAFPVGVKRCSESFFGRDLPAFRPSDATVSVNFMV